MSGFFILKHQIIQHDKLIKEVRKIIIQIKWMSAFC